MLCHPQNISSLRDTINNTSHMVIEGEPAVKHHARMSRFGLEQMETPDKTKSPLGGFIFLDLLTTNALVLLGFSIMHHY